MGRIAVIVVEGFVEADLLHAVFLAYQIIIVAEDK
jgi:hypothetical protein